MKKKKLFESTIKYPQNRQKLKGTEPLSERNHLPSTFKWIFPKDNHHLKGKDQLGLLKQKVQPLLTWRVTRQSLGLQSSWKLKVSFWEWRKPWKEKPSKLHINSPQILRWLLSYAWRNLQGAQQKARAGGLKAQQRCGLLPAGEKEFMFDSFQVRQVEQRLQLVQLKLPENHTLGWKCLLNPELEILDGDTSAISERLTFPGTQGHVCMTHTHAPPRHSPTGRIPRRGSWWKPANCPGIARPVGSH